MPKAFNLGNIWCRVLIKSFVLKINVIKITFELKYRENPNTKTDSKHILINILHWLS